MKFEEHLVGILCTSGCFWGLFGLWTSLSIQRFIVKRYEQETALLNTVFFTEHATFTRNIPNFFSSAMYTSHLLMCVWGWRIYKNRKMYRDIDNPKVVTRHFSKKEIRKAKWFAISGLIIVAHGITYYIFKIIWPEVFS